MRKSEKEEKKDPKRALSIPSAIPRPRAPERAAGPKVVDTVHRDYTREIVRLKEPVAFLENRIDP
jgi:hypothetical protein